MKRNRLKALIKQTPGLRSVARMAERALGRWGARDFSSSEYWDARYRSEGNSGPGSYNRLAQFKADFLNEFVRKHAVTSVIEFGSGDGGQLKLARYPSYIGLDISPAAIQHTRSTFSHDPTKQFMLLADLPADAAADLTLSLDVIYHLVEDPVFHSHMDGLFAASRRFVVIYASNFDRRDAAHVRHRRFTGWIEANRPDFKLIETVKNPYSFDPRNSDETSFADFFAYERDNNSPMQNG